MTTTKITLDCFTPDCPSCEEERKTGERVVWHPCFDEACTAPRCAAWRKSKEVKKPKVIREGRVR